LFSLRYSSGAKKKRKSLLYMAVHLLTIKVDFSISIINNKSQVLAVVKDIGKIYKQIKKGEKSPSTNVMFGKEVKDRSSQDRSAEKLEIMRQIDMSGVGYMKYNR
jgi:cell division protein FtsL